MADEQHHVASLPRHVRRQVTIAPSKARRSLIGRSPSGSASNHHKAFIEIPYKAKELTFTCVDAASRPITLNVTCVILVQTTTKLKHANVSSWSCSTDMADSMIRARYLVFFNVASTTRV